MYGIVNQPANPLLRILKSPALAPLRRRARNSPLLRELHFNLRVKQMRARFRDGSLPRFLLETPTTDRLGQISHFSGWYLPLNDQPAQLELLVNGQPVVALQHGLKRFDIPRLFPDSLRAFSCGFAGDLLQCSTMRSGHPFELQIVDRHAGQTLHRQTYELQPDAQSRQPRPRCYRLEELIAADAQTSRFGGAVHSLTPGELPILRVGQQGTTHHYSTDALQIIDHHADGVVLDFGAGNTPADCLRANICYLDVHQYPHTDVVCTTQRLPFKDAVFDAVISQAVFEHIPDPIATAREIHRVLKPGGIVHLDTAFQQPLHGDPSHFFNMTRHALRLVMRDFEEVRSGVKPYQFPSFGLVMSLEAALPYMVRGRWRRRLANLHRQLVNSGSALDNDLGPIGRDILAAGVFFEGRKAA